MVKLPYNDIKSVKAVFAFAFNPSSEWPSTTPEVICHSSAVSDTPPGCDPLRLDIQLHVRKTPDQVALLMYQFWVRDGMTQQQIASDMGMPQYEVSRQINDMLDERVESLRWGLAQRILRLSRELQR